MKEALNAKRAKAGEVIILRENMEKVCVFLRVSLAS